MKCKITLQERLKDLRVAHNLNLEELAKLTGISKSALGNYENDDYKEINHGNLVTLAQFYNVSTDYLLCLTENKKHPNTDLTNLHLSDDMIDLLLSGFINNRLRRWTKGYTIKQPNMDCQPTEITALMRHRAVFS